MISDDFKAMADQIPQAVAEHLDTVADAMCKSMEERLAAGDHVDFGNLITSIHAETEGTNQEIHSDIFIDAKSDKGAWYAEFLEFGTGIYNENGDGRQTPWAWQPKPGSKYYKTDANGRPAWITTRGQRPDPFIRPSVAEHAGELEEGMSYIIGDLKRYKK